MRVGVLALQGAFIEHSRKLHQLGVEAVEVRLPQNLAALDALIIPGGESTTIGRLAADYGLLSPLRQFAQVRPTWGTCAGMIFLAGDIGRDRQPILGLMDITVSRNAFGRQINSFEIDLAVPALGEQPFHAVFIRAPVVTEAGPDVDILARLDDGRIVAVRQGHLLATAFHPELTDDNRLHQYFLSIIDEMQV
jgi:5'-phosphate synthase pdxT subunit